LRGKLQREDYKEKNRKQLNPSAKPEFLKPKRRRRAIISSGALRGLCKIRQGKIVKESAGKATTNVGRREGAV